MSELRSSRLQLRVTDQQRDVIQRAADSRHETLTDYVVRHAVSAAQDDLADRRFFEISDEAWDQFQAMLDRPPEHNEKMEKLLSNPLPWDE